MAVTDIAGATVLVTGATDGPGRAVAAGLTERGARVLVRGRSAGRAEAAADPMAYDAAARARLWDVSERLSAR
jgi:NADP-dependent 3-hydroxy acid dehydrogenase YdfG